MKSGNSLHKGLRLRLVTLDDIALITRQRRLMFDEMGGFDPAKLDAMDQDFPAWLQARLQEESYIGVFLDDGVQAAAGAGLWLMPWAPGPYTAEAQRAYILNVYTEAAYRGRGCARFLVQALVAECERLGCPSVSLHASLDGRYIYDKLGFVPTNEMRLSF